ncbi:hypothetical protein KDA_53240 [Dictyobacter alpinus]|uniref:Transporter suffix domain-containing protein n=2 Tax=Dictyobacter alpinus TaxID=2014873 RepID=A0A402BEW6_9CHLR|nr:hypothetical protein KDA_53240 [Dictyobacter alpinus]
MGGGGFLILSCLIYATFFVMPFLPLSTEGRVVMGTVIILVGEGAAWLGTVLVGASVVARYKRFLIPKRWFHHGEITPTDKPQEG